MKRLNHQLLAGSIVLLLTATFSIASVKAQTTPKEKYIFTHSTTPVEVKPYSCTIYTHDGKSLKLVTGTKIFSSSDSLKTFALNPTGFSAMSISAKKKNKGRTAEIYSIVEEPHRIFRFDAKKYGNPYRAVYMPDGRSVAVATDKDIYLLDQYCPK